jgi:hypothetical protein
MNGQPCENDRQFVSRCLYEWAHDHAVQKGGAAKLYGGWKTNWLSGAFRRGQLQMTFHVKPLYGATDPQNA